MKKLVFFFFCLLLSLSLSLSPEALSAQQLSVSSHNQSQVQERVFRSMSLGRDMHYRVLLPAGYESGGRFPALYLLHGLHGDYKNWSTMTGLENYASNFRLIIAMPDADDSWYANSATVPADRFEDYVVKDFISEIDERYRTIRDRHGRAIAGLSMGGYASIKFGLKYPELFAFVGSLSGALNAAQNLDKLRPEFGAKLVEVFGNEDNPTRAENDVFTLLSSKHPNPYPYFYLACGTADSFLDANRGFAQQLSSRNLAYEYHETPGGHTWEYWDSAVQPLLKAVDHALRTSGGASNVDVQKNELPKTDVPKKRAH
jgi:Predicted esterase